MITFLNLFLLFVSVVSLVCAFALIQEVVNGEGLIYAIAAALCLLSAIGIGYVVFFVCGW